MLRSLAALLLLTAACSTSSRGAPAGVTVIAAAYPFAWLATQVGGPLVEVTNLVKPGAEPHDIELAPRQVGDLQQADVVVFLGGFQPAVDDALQEGKQGLDLSGAMGEKDHDPHVWLDPVRMQTAADALADRLAAVDPSHAEQYRTRAATVSSLLGDLDSTFRTALTACARSDIVTSHSAFGYLASRYGLVQRGISGLTPDAEPSPRDVASVAQFARKNGVTTIFFESLVDPKVARVVAAEIGARTAVLDPLEGVATGDDYLSVQKRNALALHDALGCR